MGHRANLLLVDKTSYKLFYCHWCANTIAHDVFWGPEFTIPFITRQRREDEDGWLDEVWAEGGVIVDTHDKRLLLWGGETIKYDILLRRLYLELLQEVWQGWQVYWMYDGMLDMADYVGLPRSKVWDNSADELSQMASLNLPQEKDWTDIVGSIVFEDGSLHLFPIAGDLKDNLELGSRLVEIARNSQKFDQTSIKEWIQSFPLGGFYIDVRAKQVGFWAVNEPGLYPRLEPVWIGWQLDWWKDNFEQHLTRTQNQLTFPLRTVETLLVEVDNMLMQDTDNTNTINFMLKRAAEHEDAGATAEINPYALRNDPQEIPATTKRQILDAAIAAWWLKKSATGS